VERGGLGMRGDGGEGAGKSPVVLGDGQDMRDARVRMYRMGTGTAGLIKAAGYRGQASIAYRSEQVSIDLLTKPVKSSTLETPPFPPPPHCLYPLLPLFACVCLCGWGRWGACWCLGCVSI
jgi:hypothetical protein